MIYNELKSLASEAQNRRGVSAAIRTSTPKSESLATSFDEHLLAEFKKLRPKSCWVSVFQPNLPFVTEQRVSIPSKRADGTASQKIRFEIPRVGHLLNDAKMQVKMPPVTIRERYIYNNHVPLTGSEVFFVETSGVEFQNSSGNEYGASDTSATIVIDLSSETVDQILPGFEVAFDISNGSHADLYQDDLTSYHMRPDISLAQLKLTRVVAGEGSDVVLVDLSNVVGGEDLSGNILDAQGTSGDRRYKIEITPHAVDTSLTYDSSLGDISGVTDVSSIPSGSRPDYGAADEITQTYFQVAKVYDSSLGDISGVTDVSSIPTVPVGQGALPYASDASITYTHKALASAFEETEPYSSFVPRKFELYGASGAVDISFDLSLVSPVSYKGHYALNFNGDIIYVVINKTIAAYDISMTFRDASGVGVDTLASYHDAKIKIHGEESQETMSYVHNKAIGAFTAPRQSYFVPQFITLYDAGTAPDISFDFYPDSLLLTKDPAITFSRYDASFNFQTNEKIVVEVVRNSGATLQDLDTFDIYMTLTNDNSDATYNPIDDYLSAKIQIDGFEQVYDSSMTLSNVSFTANAAEITPNYGGYVWGLGHHMIENINFLCNDKVVQTIPDAGYALHAYEHIARRGRQAKSTFQPEGVTVHELAEMSSRANTMFVNLGLFFSKGGQGNALPLTKLERSARLAVEVTLRAADELTWSLPSNSVPDTVAKESLDATFDYKDCEFALVSEHVTLSDYESGFFSNQSVPHLMTARNMIVTKIPFGDDQRLVYDDNLVTSPILSMTFAVDNPQRLVNGVSTAQNPHSIADLGVNNVKLFSRRPVQDTSMCDFYEFPRSFPYKDADSVTQYFGVRQYQTDPAHAHHAIFLPRNPFDFRHCVVKGSWPGYEETESLSELDLRVGASEQKLISDSDRLDIEFFDEYVPSRCARRMLPNGMYLYSFAEDLGDECVQGTGVLDFESQGRLSVRARTSVSIDQKPALRVYVDTLEMVKIENGLMRNISIG